MQEPQTSLPLEEVFEKSPPISIEAAKADKIVADRLRRLVGPDTKAEDVPRYQRWKYEETSMLAKARGEKPVKAGPGANRAARRA